MLSFVVCENIGGSVRSKALAGTFENLSFRPAQFSINVQSFFFQPCARWRLAFVELNPAHAG